MTKSFFTCEELYDQFVEYYGEPEEDDLKDMQIVEAAFSVVSSDGYPTDESGLVDYDAIATILQQVYAERSGRSDAPDGLDPDKLQPLGEQWLEWMEQIGDSENPRTVFALSQRLEELEAQLPAEFLAGLSVAMEWSLKQALEQAQMVEWYGEPPNPHAPYMGDAEYAKEQVCPACGSDNTPGDKIEFAGGGGMWRPTHCEDCGATWNELIRTVGYAELEVPNAK